MRTIETNVYTFDELDARAKDKARDWFRNVSSDDFHEMSGACMYDDFVTCARILGIDISTHTVRLMNGTSRQAPDIFYSGFCSQGDGASFAGTYRYAKGAAKAIREHAPLDTDLHSIAGELQRLQKRHFYGVSARISAPWSHRLNVEVAEVGGMRWDFDDTLQDILQSFADWMYEQLEKEYEYQNSDEAVNENIRANEYEFTSDGERI